MVFKICLILVIFFVLESYSAQIPQPPVVNSGNGILNEFEKELSTLPSSENAMDLIVDANTKSGIINRLIEGDIIPKRKRNGVNVDAWKWYDHKIAYVIDESGYSSNQVLMINEAILQFNRDVTCIKFVPRNGDIDYVMIKNGYGCHSSIGRDGGEQILVLGDNCFYKGVIMHELNHAAGFFHEQSRSDRDKYVQVNWENVQDGKQDDFAKQSPTILSLLGTTYDYGSIMHYGAKTFSKNGKPVLTPRYDPHGLMGQRNGFSRLDIWKLNFMYGCVKGDPPMPEWMAYTETTLQPPLSPSPPPTTSTPAPTPGILTPSEKPKSTPPTQMSTQSTTVKTTPSTKLITPSTPSTSTMTSTTTHKTTQKHQTTVTSSTKPPTTTATTQTTTVKCTEPTDLPNGIVEAPPHFNVAVFPGSLRVYWDKPCTHLDIVAYVLTYFEGASHQGHQILIHPNKLTHYISTQTHPGHKYQLSIATKTIYGMGPVSPVITTYSACGNDVTLPENGVYDMIQSPYFTQNYYEPETACQWTIKAPAGQRLKVNFESLNLIGSDKCDTDFILINNETYCKKKPTNGFVYTEGSSAKIVFVSQAGTGNKPGGFKLSVSVDDTKPKNTNVVSYPGLIHLSWVAPVNHTKDFHYSLKYRLVPEEVEVAIQLASDVTSWTIPTNINFGRLYEIDISPVSMDGEGKGITYLARAACGRNITVTSGGAIYFPHTNTTYTPDTECEWSLITPQGNHLVLDFENIDLEISEDCSKDFVEITGFGKICSPNQTRNTMESYSPVTKIKFVSDSDEEGLGFRLNYNVVSNS